MALNSGFYNAMDIGGVYDREYNADTYSNVFAAFLRDGVRRSGADDLKVTANGLTLTAAAGFAIVGGRWVHNDTPQDIGAIVPPVGDFSRIDAVILRTDASESVRACSLFIREGTPAAQPVVPALESGEGVAEIMLASIIVNPNAAGVSVTDTRGDQSVCGWITTPVGYEDYFAALDNEFNAWFKETRDAVASVTMFKEYRWHTVLEAAASVVPFDIPQYTAGGLDIVSVYVNGLREFEGVDYELNGTQIIFKATGDATGEKIAGTEIVVVVHKSVDGRGLEGVGDQLDQLQADVAGLTKTSEYDYICNGVDDNARLSAICTAWLEGGTDNGMRKVRVFGTFGAAGAVAGAGTNTNPFVWLKLGADARTNRRIAFDFSNCDAVTFAPANGTHNVLIGGQCVEVEGLNLIANNGSATIYAFTTDGAANIRATNCRFWVTAQNGLIARGGTFTGCRVSFAVTSGNAQAFSVLAGGLLRLNGGEFLAYSPSNSASAVVYVAAAQAGAVVITNGITCPQIARSGFTQDAAVNVLSSDAHCSFTDTVTPLTITAGGQNIRGTIVANKTGMW